MAEVHVRGSVAMSKPLLENFTLLEQQTGALLYTFRIIGFPKLAFETDGKRAP